MSGLIVVGGDTGVGKTLVSAALMAAHPTANYWKPVQTGLADEASDSQTVQRLAQLAAERVLDRGVRLGLSASPHFAAQQAGVAISLPALAQIWQERDQSVPWIVEGAGGLLVPLNRSDLLLDFLKLLQLPLLLVVSTKLGAINHALLSERELARNHLPLLGFVLSGPPSESLRTALQQHARQPILAEIGQLDDTAAALQCCGQTLMQHMIIARTLL